MKTKVELTQTINKFKEDIESGIIEVYSPNTYHDKLSLERIYNASGLNGFNILTAANSLMIMYSLNYYSKGGMFKERVDKWNAYYKKLKK